MMQSPPSQQLLAELYHEDRQEHSAVPPVGTPEYAILRERDRERRRRAAEAVARLEQGEGTSPDDLYHAAWLFNHGETPGEARQAHDWARAAAEAGHAPARWLAAASYDRWCMYEGRPQKYGTQFVPDGRRYRLWDVEASTTDRERARWDVAPLEEQRQRAEDLSDLEPQPDMSTAPAWLRAALDRWAGS